MNSRNILPKLPQISETGVFKDLVNPRFLSTKNSKSKLLENYFKSPVKSK